MALPVTVLPDQIEEGTFPLLEADFMRAYGDVVDGIGWYTEGQRKATAVVYLPPPESPQWEDLAGAVHPRLASIFGSTWGSSIRRVDIIRGQFWVRGTWKNFATHEKAGAWAAREVSHLRLHVLKYHARQIAERRQAEPDDPLVQQAVAFLVGYKLMGGTP